MEALKVIVHLAGDEIVCVRKLRGKGTIISELWVRASNRCCAGDVVGLMERAARGAVEGCWPVRFRELGVSGEL